MLGRFFNQSEEFNRHLVADKETLHIILLVRQTLMITTIVMGLFGNGLTIAAFFRSRFLQNPGHALVINIELIDLIYCLVAIPPLAIDTNLRRRYMLRNEIICQIQLSVMNFWRYASPLALSVVAIDRLICVAKPVQYKSIFTKKVTLLVIALTWILPGIAVLLPAIGLIGVISYKEDGYWCVLALDSVRPIYVVVVGVFFSWGTLFVLFVCYAYIYYRISRNRLNKRMISQYRNRRARSHGPETAQGRQELKNERRLAISCSLVCAVYMLTAIPYNVMLVLPFTVQAKYAIIIFDALFGQNAYANFIIYAMTNKRFKQAYKNILCCLKIKCEISCAENQRSSHEEEI